MLIVLRYISTILYSYTQFWYKTLSVKVIHSGAVSNLWYTRVVILWNQNRAIAIYMEELYILCTSYH